MGSLGPPCALIRVVALLSIVSMAAGQSLPGLRIMPLGDSITKGNGAKDGTGYRNKLRSQLLSYGTDSDVSVDMIGSLADGKMTDNNHEGHSGKYVQDIKGYLDLSIDAKPNVVLVHAGTNNMDKNVDLDIADTLIENIIDKLFEGSPDAVILVAPVIWANNPPMQANTDKFNLKLEASSAGRRRRESISSLYQSTFKWETCPMTSTPMTLAMLIWPRLGLMPSWAPTSSAGSSRQPGLIPNSRVLDKTTRRAAAMVARQPTVVTATGKAWVRFSTPSRPGAASRQSWTP